MVAELPAGSLIVLDAPASGELERENDGTPIPIWVWSMPYAVRPPFVSAELGNRAAVVGTRQINCCPAERWFQDTRGTVQEWSASKPDARVIVLRWSADGALAHASDIDLPQLRARVQSLSASNSAASLEDRLRDLLNEVPLATPANSPA
jgi:hypothetical protein